MLSLVFSLQDDEDEDTRAERLQDVMEEDRPSLDVELEQVEESEGGGD